MELSERTCLAERGANRLPREPALPCTLVAPLSESSPRPAGPVDVPLPNLSAMSRSLQNPSFLVDCLGLRKADPAGQSI